MNEQVSNGQRATDNAGQRMVAKAGLGHAEIAGQQVGDCAGLLRGDSPGLAASLGANLVAGCGGSMAQPIDGVAQRDVLSLLVATPGDGTMFEYCQVGIDRLPLAKVRALIARLKVEGWELAQVTHGDGEDMLLDYLRMDDLNLVMRRQRSA